MFFYVCGDIWNGYDTVFHNNSLNDFKNDDDDKIMTTVAKNALLKLKMFLKCTPGYITKNKNSIHSLIPKKHVCRLH